MDRKHAQPMQSQQYPRSPINKSVVSKSCVVPRPFVLMTFSLDKPSASSAQCLPSLADLRRYRFTFAVMQIALGETEPILHVYHKSIANRFFFRFRVNRRYRFLIEIWSISNSLYGYINFKYQFWFSLCKFELYSSVVFLISKIYWYISQKCSLIKIS